VAFWKVVVRSPNSIAKLMRSRFPPAQSSIQRHSIEQEDEANKPSCGGQRPRLCHNHSHHHIPCTVARGSAYLPMATHSAVSQRSTLDPKSPAPISPDHPKPHVVACFLPNGHQASAQATHRQAFQEPTPSSDSRRLDIKPKRPSS
jgi:hypothetical protein